MAPRASRSRPRSSRKSPYVRDAIGPLTAVQPRPAHRHAARRSRRRTGRAGSPRWRRQDVFSRPPLVMSVVLWILAALLVCVGIAGIILPALPGTILIFAGLMLAAWADGFMRVGPITLVVIGLIGAATYGIDFLAAALGAQRLGASRAM